MPPLASLKLFDCCAQVFPRLFLELGDAYVAVVIVEHPVLDALDRDGVALDLKILGKIEAFAHYGQCYGLALLSPDELDDVDETHILRRLAVDLYDLV